MYAVILAGGGGTRLWPLSSPERPKPFLPLFPDGTLFEKTIARLRGLELEIPDRDITVVAPGRYADLVRRQAPGVRILEEPEGRNTAAAIALATLAIDRDPDEVMVVLPADHLIGSEGLFRAVLADAEAGVARHAFGVDSPLVTLGVQIDRAATEYGYLIPKSGGGDTINGLHVDHLERFEEKPSAERAAELRHYPGATWNAGMFMWRRRAIRQALDAHAPDILRDVARGLDGGDLRASYSTVRSISIDYAVMEPASVAGQVVMGSMDVGWSDLGSWSALLEALGMPGIEARVVQPGETIDVAPDDLVVERTGDRVAAVAPSGRGTMSADQPIALLSGARPHEALIEALLDRCSRPEG